MTPLSNSGVGCFRDCHKKYQLRYEDNLQKVGDEAPALHFGRLFHGAIAEWSILRDVGAAVAWLERQPCSESNRSYVGAMVRGYAKRWGDETPPMICEQEFTAKIVNPFTGRHSMRFEQFGIMDAVAIDGGAGVWLWERKTAADIGPGYLEKLWADSQITGYVAALRDEGIDVRGVIYDIIKKTKIRQKKQETEAEFWERREELYLSSPDLYHREEVFISDQQIEDWRRDVWQVTQEILSCRRTGHWYRNTNRCWDFYRACEFVQLCQSGENPILIDTHYGPRKRREDEDKKQPASHELAF